MIRALVLAIAAILVASVLDLVAAGRRYWPVPLAQMATTTRTHVCTRGPVVYVRRQQDGDWHITLDDGRGRVVAEIIPLIPLAPPRKGQRVEVCGIVRIDRTHGGWPEIHPAESIRVLR